MTTVVVTQTSFDVADGVTMPPDLAAAGWQLIPMRNHLYYAEHPHHGRTAAPVLLCGDDPAYHLLRKQIELKTPCPECGWEIEEGEAVHCQHCQQVICSECYANKGHVLQDDNPDEVWAAVRGDTKEQKEPRPSPAPVTTPPENNGWRIREGANGWVATNRWLIPDDNRGYGVMTRICKDEATLLEEIATYNTFRETISRLSDKIKAQEETIAELASKPTTAAPPNPAAQSSLTPRLTAINTAIHQLQQQESQCRAAIERLDTDRCVGTTYARTLTSGTVAIYANHTAGVTCPYCGSHPDGGRLRKYVGAEGTVGANNALLAMTHQKEWEAATAELQNIQQKLHRIERLLWQLEEATMAKQPVLFGT